MASNTNESYNNDNDNDNDNYLEESDDNQSEDSDEHYECSFCKCLLTSHNNVYCFGCGARYCQCCVECPDERFHHKTIYGTKCKKNDPTEILEKKYYILNDSGEDESEDSSDGEDEHFKYVRWEAREEKKRKG